jgi:hypothetical protein
MRGATAEAATLTGEGTVGAEAPSPADRAAAWLIALSSHARCARL